jgi:hypothetical protein
VQKSPEITKSPDFTTSPLKVNMKIGQKSPESPEITTSPLEVNVQIEMGPEITKITKITRRHHVTSQGQHEDRPETTRAMQ